MGFDDTAGLQLSIRTGDRVVGKTEISRELPHGRQFVPGCKLALGRAFGDLPAHLLERWLNTRHINGELTHTAILP